MSTRAEEASRRIKSCEDKGIFSEKKSPHRLPLLFEGGVATICEIVDYESRLADDGRAARITRSPAGAARHLVQVDEACRHPRHQPLVLEQLLDLREVLFTSSRIGTKPAFIRSSATANIALSASSRISSGLLSAS